MGPLLERDDNAILPLSIAPDQLWFGNDGPWSSFLLGYGTPAQYVKSYISTTSPQPYVVLPGGCIATDASDCSTIRGGFFNPNESSTWQSLGDFTLEIEKNLGINDAGNFGFDTIALGVPGSNAPSMQSQVVVGIVAKDFFLATWGLRPTPTNFTTLNNPVPSLLENLKTQDKIPSLSWAYTAGSYQQSRINKNGGGSLTIGGYDASRFQPNNATFDFVSNTSRDLVVAVLSISTADGSTPLLGGSILMFLDSGVSHLWLPQSACQLFQDAFNLTYDESLDLYLVNETVHTTLMARNASIFFTISNDLTISSVTSPLTIEIPYSAFDLQLTPDYPNNQKNATYYFPIRRAANESQYTLGRAFFQHAYVIADYERSTFAVHQAPFPASGAQQNLQVIPPLVTANATNSTAPQIDPSHSTTIDLSAGAPAGIIVGVIIGVLVVVFGGCWTYRKRRRNLGSSRSPSVEVVKVEMDGETIPNIPSTGEPKLELEGRATGGALELPVHPYSNREVLTHGTVCELPSSVIQTEMGHQWSLERDRDEQWEMP